MHLGCVHNQPQITFHHGVALAYVLAHLLIEGQLELNQPIQIQPALLQLNLQQCFQY